MYSLRLASGSSSSTGLGFVLGRFGGKRGGGGGVTAPISLLVPAAAARGGRSVSATSNDAAPAPGDQGVGMEQGKQQQQQPRRDAAGEQGNSRDDMHKTTGDVMTHSFGEGYSTRSDEEGFGGVYGGNDPAFSRRTDEVHRPSHPEYDTSQGSEVNEKEKARHLKDDKHVT